MSFFTLFVFLVLLFVVPLQGLAEPQDTEELATYMGELQRLTHKLDLSVQAGNTRLASFYLYESLEVYREIQQNVPEYESIPVALYIDRLALPAYEKLKAELQTPAGASAEPVLDALRSVIKSCNTCHEATQFEFINIVPATVNPFNQNFNP